MLKPSTNTVKRPQIARALNNDQAMIRSYEELLKLLNPPFGHMHATNVSVTVTVLAANTPYEVGAGFTAGQLNNVNFYTATPYYLEITDPGTYFLSWSMSIDTANPLDQIEGGYMIDAVAKETSTSHTTVPAAGDASTIASTDIVDLSAGQKISLYVRNHTAARNIVMHHGTLTLYRLVV